MGTHDKNPTEMTDAVVSGQIRQSKVLSRIVAVVTSLLLIVFFTLTMSNMTVVQGQIEDIKNDPYPVSVAAGRVETLLVQLRTIAQSSIYTNTPEATIRMQESYKQVDLEIMEGINFITDSSFINLENTGALKDGYKVLCERQQVLVSMMASNSSSADKREYVDMQINPLINGLLSLDTAILDESTHLVDNAYVAINNATNQTIFISWIIIIAVIVSLIVLLAILSRKNRREGFLRASLKEALEDARAASRAKSTFLSSMSHDIRTPMNAIVGFTEIAHEHINEPDRVEVALNRIDTSSKHLLSLINDVLDMSEIESGRIALNEETFSLSALIDEFVTIVQPQALGKNLDFGVQLNNVTEDMLVGDTVRINQLLLNLASNAIKYTNRGGSVLVTISELPSTKSGYSNFCIQVDDTGIGMSPEFLDTIFDPFSREHNDTTSRTEGAGLGMSITKNIVDLMKGTIEVKSEVGKGSSFKVMVPIKIASGENLPVNIPMVDGIQSSGSDGAEAGSGQAESEDTGFSGRILLVEDDAINREIAIELIEPLGVKVEVACDGLEACERMESVEPGYYDLVFMDCQMPQMGGIEATEHIVAWEKETGTEHTPIVAMTANAFNEDRVRAMEAGMDGFMTKPISVTELKRNLHVYLNRNS